MDQQGPPRIEFENQGIQMPTYSRRSTAPKLVSWVINNSGGAIKDEKQANYVLAGFALLAILVSIIILVSRGPDVPREALKNPEYGLPERD